MDRAERLNYDKRIRKATMEDLNNLDKFLAAVPEIYKRRYFMCKDAKEDAILSKKKQSVIYRVFSSHWLEFKTFCDCD